MTDIDLQNYPDSWDDLVGQANARKILEMTAASARIRGDRMPHTLLTCGTAGVGKTAMALLTAREVGGVNAMKHMEVISGALAQADARMLISGMDDGDVLLWDEIHLAVTGGKAKAEWLLNFLQDGVITGPRGRIETMPKITVIGATTDAGKLPTTILSRFLRVELSVYNLDEAAQIAFRTGAKVFASTPSLPLPSADDFIAVAEAACRRPRDIRRILCAMRDEAIWPKGQNFDRNTGTYDMSKTLDLMGLDRDGLNAQCREYLVLLMTRFSGGVGERPLQDALSEPGGLRDIEYVLMDKQLIEKTPRGRDLTREGMVRAREIIAQRKEEEAA